MIKSEPILPLRFYNNLYDQRRFNIHTPNDECTFDLVYPPNDLPKFQFTRPSKFQLPTNFYIRSVCNDVDNNYYKIIPEGADTFGVTDYYGDLSEAEQCQTYHGEEICPDRTTMKFECGKLVSIPLSPCTPDFANSSIFVPLPFDYVVQFQFKIVVDTFYAATTFQIRIKLNGTIFATIASAGIFNYSFVNPSGNDQIEIEFYNYGCDDYFSISYMQGTTLLFQGIFPDTDDVQMNEVGLKVLPMQNGTDIIAFCAGNNANIAPGDYYYVVVCGADFYFSEVFKIKTAREIEKYYRLKWWSECDLNDAIIYKLSTLSCQFTNTVYLEAGLFKPEYDTKEDSEENGKGDANIVFQRWQKNINLDVLSPEFLTDALSGIFLHEFIYLKKPLNRLQEFTDSEYRVLKVVPDIEEVLFNYYQKVTMKLLLSDRYTDTTCCNEAAIFDCTPCQYDAGEECGGDHAYILKLSPAGAIGLYSCPDEVRVAVKATDIICYGGKYYRLAKDGDNYVIIKTMPKVDTITLSFVLYHVFGSVLPYAWATVQYNKDGAGWVDHDTVQGNSDGDIHDYIGIWIVAGATDFKVRIKMKTLNCDDLGTSDEYDLI